MSELRPIDAGAVPAAFQATASHVHVDVPEWNGHPIQFAIIEPGYFMREEPRSYRAPCDADLGDISPGDCIDLAFDATSDVTPRQTERSWFMVTCVEQDRLTATVLNDRRNRTTPFERGDSVTVPKRYVIDISLAKARAA